ncbi:MAG: metallophosphoesterase [Acidobacteria bacterium]|nr:metallophosphoesterase [Acidobacteriota bacterium]
MVRRVGSLSSLVEIGPGRMAYPSGALWLPDEGALLIADAHLGYGWAQHRRGKLGPLLDETLPAILARVLNELTPRRVVLLGDIVHAPNPAPVERELIERTLASLAARAELVLVRGNHDQLFAEQFAATRAGRWETRSLVAVHGDRFPTRIRTRHIIAGHWHPSLAWKDAAGVPHCFPVFAVSGSLTVRPPFSPFSAGYNLRRRGIPPEWPCRGRLALFAATATRVAALPCYSPRLMS